MADTEIVKILLQLDNPAILDRIEKAKADTRIKFTADLGKGFQELLEITKKMCKLESLLIPLIFFLLWGILRLPLKALNPYLQLS